MPDFTFRVGTPDGQITHRSVKAASQTAAEEEIRRQGLHIFKVERRGLSLPSFFSKGRRVISTERFLLFNQELLALVRAGLPIVQSFEIMLERQKNPRFAAVLADIREKIKSGVALSDAFASYGAQFPPIYSTSLRAGERSGDLEGVLRRFLRYQKLIVGLRKKIIGALIYPAVIIMVSIGMIFVMMTYVIPKFTEFYTGFDAELPPFTRLLIAVSLFVRNNTLLAVGAIFVLAIVTRKWSATAMGGRRFDAFKLRIPFVGSVMQRFAILQFSQSMATLLAGGTPMVPSIEIASQSITNRFVAAKVEAIAQNVRQGEPLWRSLESTGVMSDLAIEMIKVGESTGALVEMLTNVGEFYDEEIEASLSRMISFLEPAILVVLGLVIAALLYAFYLPLFQLAGQQRF